MVMLALGKSRRLLEVFGEPARPFRQLDKAALDHCGLGVHPHDFIGLRLVAGDGVQALLDQFLETICRRGLLRVSDAENL